MNVNVNSNIMNAHKLKLDQMRLNKNLNMTARDAKINELDQHNANNYTTSRRHDNDLIDFQV